MEPLHMPPILPLFHQDFHIEKVWKTMNTKNIGSNSARGYVSVRNRERLSIGMTNMEGNHHKANPHHG